MLDVQAAQEMVDRLQALMFDATMHGDINHTIQSMYDMKMELVAYMDAVSDAQYREYSGE